MVRWQISAILGSAAAVAIAAAALIAGTGDINRDIASRTAQVLAGEATSWAHVTLSGRDVHLAGQAPSEELRRLAISRISRVFGVRTVDDSDAGLLPEVKPYRLAIVRDGNGVALEGYAPSLPDRTRLDTALHGALGVEDYANRLELARGQPDGRFLAVASSLMPVAGALSSGRVEIVDHAVSIVGEAASNADYEKLSAARPVLPEAYAYARFELVRPLATPFTWSVDLRAGELAVGGFAPDAATHDRLLAAVRDEADGRPVHDGSDLASGAPDGFADTVEAAIDYLDLFAEGHIGVVDKTVSLSGRALTPGSYRTLSAYLETWSPPGFRVQSSIDLPIVAPYTLTISRVSGRVTVSGFAPDDATRDGLTDTASAASSGPAVVEVTLADGAPEGFSGASRYAFDLLGKCSDGSVLIADRHVRLDCVALTGGDLIELNAAASNPPAGYIVDLKAEPPAVSPYVWRVEKTEDQLILTGSAPSEAVRTAIGSALDSAAADLAVYDKTSLATGLPEGVDLSAVADLAATVLAHLDRGSVTLSDRRLSVSGTAPSPAERAVAVSVLDRLPNGIEKGDVAIEAAVHFRLVIERGLDTLALDGEVADPAGRDALIDAVRLGMGSVDLLPSLDVVDGAAPGVGAAELLAVRAASRLAKGRVTVEDGLITVTGQAFTGVGATRLPTELSADLPAGYRLAASVGAAPAEPETDAAGCEARLATVLGRADVHFAPGSSDPLPESRGVVDRLSAVALACPAARLAVSGGTDADGSSDLGLARAESVAEALAEAGVDRARVTTAAGPATVDGRGGIAVHATP